MLYLAQKSNNKTVAHLLRRKRISARGKENVVGLRPLYIAYVVSLLINNQRNFMKTTQKHWSSPSLAMYGDVEEITADKDKFFDGDDGFTFQGQSIGC